MAYGYHSGQHFFPASSALCGIRVSVLNDHFALVIIKNIGLEKLDKTSTHRRRLATNVPKESSKHIQDLRVFGSQSFAATINESLDL
jgi:hypothetical protein